MEKFKIVKPDSNVVACVKEIPEAPKGIVIAVHGFSSCKESPTVQMLLRRLPAAGYGVIGIDLPGHGSEESKQEELRIEGCKNSIEAAEKYALENYPGLDIFYFGSSFGAYSIGLYVSTRPHTGKKAFFRSGAVNMQKMFVTDHPNEMQKMMLDILERDGYIDTNMGLNDSVRITMGMYNDLKENDLFEIFDPAKSGVAVPMAHGAEDNIVAPAAAKAFAEKFGLPITLFEGEGHSLSNDPGTPDKVADLAIEFFGE